MERKLQISDLSIGDWVMVKGKAVKVESLGKIRNYVELEGSLALFHIKAVQPIPVTPEILEKNGFEKYNGIWHQPNSYIEFCRNKDSWERTVNCGEYDIYSIKYIHELQHALRLEGVEKEIEL